MVFLTLGIVRMARLSQKVVPGRFADNFREFGVREQTKGRVSRRVRFVANRG
jgi:hypothetical protein